MNPDRDQWRELSIDGEKYFQAQLKELGRFFHWALEAFGSAAEPLIIIIISS